MPSLSFFVDEHDLHLLLDRLNWDPEIAFIVPDHEMGRENSKQVYPSSFWRPIFRILVGGSEPELQMKQAHLQTMESGTSRRCFA